MANETHVPAWKKLGLKLKYAKEEDPEQHTEARGRCEKDESVQGSEEPVKKAEGDKKEKKKKRRLEETEDKGDSAAADEESSKRKKKQKKEKKVSFSAETKVEDGCGDEGAKGEKSEDAVPDGNSGDVQTEEKPGAEEKRQRMKEKKERKKKQEQLQPQAPPSNIHETPILQYLHLYHENRSAWKFQKNRETQLFKHILAPERVPTEYNAALLSYLHGLKGEAARQRLSQSAEEVVKTEMEEQIAKENAEEAPKEGQSAPDMADYYKAVEAFRKRLSQGSDDLNNIEALEGQETVSGDLRKRLEKRLRAEVITFAINGKLSYVQRPKSSQKGKSGPQQIGGQAQAPAKKKKNRTAVIDISSSSESDSDSSSDSDSDDDKPLQKKKPSGKQQTGKQSEAPAKKKKNRTAVVDISSSSESDSDSSSDSESDSDSEGGNNKKTKAKRDEDERFLI